MDEPTRRIRVSRPIEAAAGASQAGEPDERASSSERPSGERTPRTSDARFVGDAMRSLYQSAEAQVVRGDSTRVISRSTPPPSAAPSKPASSSPPGPRVDVTLWVVLALGLFAIAGVMLTGAL